MKILHVMPKFNYIISDSFIKFINEKFGVENHDFVFFANKDEVPNSITLHKNIIFNSDKYIIKMRNKYKKIIFHHLFTTSPRTMIRLLLHPFLTQKIVWVAWGADLYNWKIIGKTTSIKIKNLIRYILIKKIKYFAGLFPPDIDFFKKTFNTKAKTFNVTYLGGLYKQTDITNITKGKLMRKDNDPQIKIMIGHSATRVLKHIEALIELKKFSNENIKIFVPLSYGDSVYGDLINKKSKELFGEKVTCIRTIMPKDEYEKFLSTIDIAIFNTERQIGLGNVIPLLDMGKKIFFPANSVMYKFFKSKNIEVFEYDNIEDLNFNEFIASIEMPNAKEYVKSLSIEAQYEQWNLVFKEGR